jgi:pimeloyl-ACP methyl ester carboxylesterase
VHGFSVPYFIYDPTFAFLTRSGFRVLRYDLFGRGFSDRPNVDYNIDLFVNQLLDLLDELRITQPVNLIGLSMGGPITSAFTVRHPQRVNKLLLIDPAGTKALHIPSMLKLLKIPWAAQAIFRLVGVEVMVRNIARDFFDPALVEHFQENYKVQMQYKGFQRAILSTTRHGMLDSFIHVYAALGKLDKPILIFWGRNDKTVPFEHSQDLCAALPTAKLEIIENCGHIPHYEKPEVVNPILLDFLRQT